MSSDDDDVLESLKKTPKEFFIINKKNQVAICKICKNDNKIRQIKMTNSGTTGLHRHLKNMHAKIAAEIFSSVSEKRKPETKKETVAIKQWMNKKVL